MTVRDLQTVAAIAEKTVGWYAQAGQKHEHLHLHTVSQIAVDSAQS